MLIETPPKGFVYRLKRPAVRQAVYYGMAYCSASLVMRSSSRFTSQSFSDRST